MGIRSNCGTNTHETMTNEIVVLNDDSNTFEHVIITLMRGCDHTTQQAEQCASIVHNTGRCSVKIGSVETLKPMCDFINNEGINAIIV